MALPPRPPRLAIFDLDGVVYRGDVPVPGAVAAIAALERAGMAVRFATNNSTVSREVYVARLAGMGIPDCADRVVTSTSATIDHLRRHLPQVRSTLILGGPGMLDELVAAGFEARHAAEAEDEAYQGGPLRRAWDAVVIGLDRRLTYRSLGDRRECRAGGCQVHRHERGPSLSHARRFPARRGCGRGGRLDRERPGGDGDREALAGDVHRDPRGGGMRRRRSGGHR